MHFQQAAWPFICLRDDLNARRCGLVDFDDISLTFYANVMLVKFLIFILKIEFSGSSTRVHSREVVG